MTLAARQLPVKGSRPATLAATSVIFILPFFVSWAQAASAQDCPTGPSAAAGFVVEREERSKTEVFHVGDTNVRTILRYGGTALLETTQYQGLFELERIDRGRRSVFRPTGDISKVFPPNVGQKFSARFAVTEGERKSTRTIVLSVKKLDALHIGPCQYRVLLIDKSVGYDNAKPVFIETGYYSPVLKLVIGKEFKERGGRTTLIKFDRIYPLKRLLQCTRRVAAAAIASRTAPRMVASENGLAITSWMSASSPEARSRWSA
jgi:hypothetical protein